MGTDKDWEAWGQQDPYFGVITYEKFRRTNLTEERKKEFFESGKIHIDYMLNACRRHIDPNFAPQRILDFGCGVGRLVVPFSKIAEYVAGLDVSDAMLDEARKNCEEHGLKNVRLVKSDDELSGLSVLGEKFDFIHSYIVFQHIPVSRGRRIFRKLIEHLAEGGICALHITYSKSDYWKNFGVKHPKPWRIATHPCQRSYRERDHSLKMQMNPYNTNELLFIMQSCGIRNTHIQFADHGGELGLVLYFQKPNTPLAPGYHP